MRRRGPTVRTARWSAMHPWRAVAGWIAFVALCVGVGAAVGTDQASGDDFRVGEAGRAERTAADAGVAQPLRERVLLTAPVGGPGGPALAAAAGDVTRRLRELPEVATVSGPERSADGAAVLVTATLRAESTASADLSGIEARVADAQRSNPDVRFDRTGTASISDGNSAQLGDDLLRAEAITLPVTLVVLAVVFGALLAAAVPVLLALSSVGAAMGLYGLASSVFPDAGGAVANVVLLMGMAVGVDYSLFYLKRVREERDRAPGPIGRAEVVEAAAVTSGRAVVVSAVAVVVALAGLYLADDVIFSSIATGTIIVVLVAMVSSVTVLPALLVLLGTRAATRGSRRSGPGRLWPALLRPATRRPLLTLVLSAGAMLLLALPALGLTLRVEGNDTFPRSIPAIATYDRMVDAFPAEGVAHVVVVRAAPAEAAQVHAALTGLAVADPVYVRVDPPRLRTSADGTVSTLEIPVPTGANSPASVQSLERLRVTLLPVAVGRIPGAEYAVSGEVARSIDYVGHQGERTPLVVGFVLLATFATMGIAFRSGSSVWSGSR